jgi:hypothetical protein
MYVAPERVGAELATRWPTRTRTVASFPTPPAAPSDAAQGEGEVIDAGSWDAGLRELGTPAQLRGARFGVELANSLVHFDVAEGNFAADGDRQLQAIAVACMAELLGDAAGAHEVRWSLQADERHLLIAAVPKAFVVPLAAVARRQGTRLESVQPALCRQWNAYARSLHATTAIFAVALDSYALVACVVNGSICGVSVGQWDAVSDSVRAMPLATSGALLDERAERLLASLGIDVTPGTEFTALAADPHLFAAQPRWKVIPSTAPLS